MSTMRTFRVAALGATLLLGTVATVTAQVPATGQRQGEVDRRDRGDRGQPRRELGRHRGGAGRAGAALFRGITLTDAQRTQIRAIHQKYAEQRRDFARDLRRQAGVQQGQRPDSAARAQLRTRMQTESRAAMERQVAELRGVLTAEQRGTFDRNVTELRERMQARAERGPGRDRPGFRRGV